MCRVAVVILNWNGAEMLRRYLPSVIRCSEGDGFEVIVADNASTDDSTVVMKNEFPDVRVISLDENYGFAEGYNRAISEIDAEYCLLLNSDVEIRQQGWLEPMVSFMDANPNVAACQPKLLKLHEDQSIQEFEYAGAAGGYIDRYGYPYCRGRIFATVEKDNHQYDEQVPVMWVTGAAMMVRTEVYRKAGGLDSKFFAHMEEIDLCWRMRIMGHQLYCVTQSTAYHLGGATLNQGSPRKTFLNFRNNLLMLYKNLPEPQLSPTLRIRRVLDWVAALQFLLKGDVNNMKAVLRAQQEFRSLIPQYLPIRQDIQRQRKSSKTDNDLTDVCLLYQYYIKGKKTFQAITNR